LPYFWSYVINSLSIAYALTPVAVLFFCSLAGYGFAKFRFPGRDVLFALIATLMVPGALGLIPSFVVRWDTGVD
jgi:ABC-type glycerol-3-phosphate transport system permease component